MVSRFDLSRNFADLARIGGHPCYAFELTEGVSDGEEETFGIFGCVQATSGGARGD